MEQIYEIEPLLKAGACIQIYPCLLYTSDAADEL